MSLLIQDRQCSRLHFVGIFGSGMSALAQYCSWCGITVSGSDRLLGSSSVALLQQQLIAAGCRIVSQDGSGVTSGVDAVVVSTAIEEGNPEIRKAQSLKIAIVHRADLLAAISTGKKTIAVAGTSGKSTVTALLFHLLTQSNKKPSLIGGANMHGLMQDNLVGNAFAGDSEYLVIEADESDGSLVKYKPYVSTILNVSKDHKPVPEVISLFSTLASQSGHVFVNYDDMLLRPIPHTRSFGTHIGATLHPDGIKNSADGVVLTFGTFEYRLPFPGTHMASNLLAAIQVALFLGCSHGELTAAAATYQGIARRFDRIQTRSGITVIDDYAHNPEKIGATIRTVQQMTPRMHALFQPHGFGPTKFMLHELITVFRETLRPNDTLFLLPIYFAGGTVSRDISSFDIAEGLRKCASQVIAPQNRDDVIAIIASSARSGDIVLSMGGRDPSLPDFAHSIAAALDRTTSA
ncbi:MAG: hypothetical protein JW795_16290 [Chitinivibrionales bacterium]|nr:hypothetical protein [Chitinivibrionales bacterium]